MKRTLVAIRVDASVQIGSGHVMRCLTLADGLHLRGAEVVFVCREHVGHLCDFVEEKGYRVHRLHATVNEYTSLDQNRYATWLGAPWEKDSRETIETLGKARQYDWMIIDHYALDRKWEQSLRPKAKRIMVIDDLADRPHDCDLLLDQNYYSPHGSRYENLVPDDCIKLFGPKFALLRPEFAEARKTVVERSDVVNRILVFMGGADPGNAAGIVLDALDRLNRNDLQIDLVVGAQSVHREALLRQSSIMPQVVWHENIRCMAELMSQADLAIGAGGSSTWERCCLGLPTLVFSLADNQKQLCAFGAEQGLFHYLGGGSDVSADALAECLRVYFAAPHNLRGFSHRSFDIVDGLGVQRVCETIMPTPILLRQATFADCDAIFAWRNAEETRRHVFDYHPISLETHHDWYRKVMSDPGRIILIGEVSGCPVGVLRYDLNDETALVSIYLVPGNQGQGIGTRLLCVGNEWIHKFYPKVCTIRAEILCRNIRSLRAFERAGYKRHHVVYHKDLC